MLKDRFAGGANVPMSKALIVCLTAGLIWQFVLAAIPVGPEPRTISWSTIREALSLRRLPMRDSQRRCRGLLGAEAIRVAAHDPIAGGPP